MQSLDNEMDVLEREVPLFSGFIAPTDFGAPHDHTKCPAPPRVTGTLLDGHATHWGTPINPKHQGLMINIFGEGETDYLEFVDVATESQFALHRQMTSPSGVDPGLSNGSVSDIAMRNSPISAVTESEIKRLARPAAVGGCRLTYGSNRDVFEEEDKQRIQAALHRLGQVVQQARIFDPAHPEDPAQDREVWVIDVR